MTGTYLRSKWEVGAIRGPHSHRENVCMAKAAPGGTMWVSNGLMVWSILTLVVVVCRLTVLFFQP